ncbi:unnamed protein product, partial [Prorocentrum cordatum]
FTVIMREHADFLVDRYSERKEVAERGRLLTQERRRRAAAPRPRTRPPPRRRRRSRA